MSMPEERTCDYTGEPIEPGTGIMYVKADGEILHFVDSKAEKNYLLGREPRELEWTEAGRANRGKDSSETSPSGEGRDDDATASPDGDDGAPTETEAVDVAAESEDDRTDGDGDAEATAGADDAGSAEDEPQ